MTETGYVLFEDVGINHRVFHSYHNSYGQAYKAQRKHRGNVTIGVMSKAEYEGLMEE